MKCNQYEKFELGNISPAEFELHVKSCVSCREAVQQDNQILHTAAGLNESLQIPDLWAGIEQKLKKEQKKNILSFPVFRSHILKIAAVFLIGISLATYFYLTPEPGYQTILNASALQEVEQKENEYIRAINRLEKMALVRMDNFDINLALLYRDKLETIDSQIERCKDALETNPANTHIRSYLLAALDDKKETLKEMLQ